MKQEFVLPREVVEQAIDALYCTNSKEGSPAYNFELKAIKELRAALEQPQGEQEPVAHPDDAAIDRFAAAMKAKMAKQRSKGYGGWEDKADCPASRLQQMLVDHIAKGDPVDVANFTMMLWSRGEHTEQPQQEQEWKRRLGNLLAVIHGDGGHYIDAHGWGKAQADAEEKAARIMTGLPQSASAVWPRNASEVRAFLSGRVAAERYARDDHQPDDSDTYTLSAHDLLGAIDWWTDFDQQPRQPLTHQQIDAIAESMPGGLDGFLKGWGWRQFARAVLEAAPQPPTAEQSSAVVEECSADELKPRFSAHDDAERLKSVARGMSYNDHGEAVWKHTLMEIAVRLESGGYAAPQPPALEQQVEKESTCKDSLQVEQEPVATLHCTEECYVYARATDAGKRIRFEQPINLYTHPHPKREPLTHYEIHELFRRSWDDCQDGDEIKAFARAIEAAHNIK